MTAIVLFVISLVGIVGLISFKRWELSRNTVVGPKLRNKLDSATQKGNRVLKENVPALGKKVSQNVVHHTVYHTSSFGLAVLKFVERRLLKIVNLIKGKGVVEKNGSASSFLRNVKEHKEEVRRQNGYHDSGNL